MKIHFLKTHKDYYFPVQKFKKQFEIRNNEGRDFAIGDILVLIAVDDGGKQLRPIETTTRIVEFVLNNDKFLQPNYVALSISTFSLFAYLSDQNFEEFRGHYDRIMLSNETYSYEVL